MGTSIAIAAAASAQAAVASQRALEAKKIACKDLEAHFKGTEAVEIKQQYADCIELLYPAPISNESVIVSKILIILMFVGIITGFVQALKDSEDWLGCLLHSILWGLGLPLFAIVILGLYQGALYLFN